MAFDETDLSWPVLYLWNLFGWMKSLLPVWLMVWLGKTYVFESWNDSFMDIHFLGWIGICMFVAAYDMYDFIGERNKIETHTVARVEHESTK